MDASLERGLDDVIEALRHSRDAHEKGCSLLIGAGCSATAGVATAAGFVRIIEDRFKAAHSRAAKEMASGPPGYPQCMAKLSRGQQRDLINEQVRAARINWAHMAIAQLMKHGYVDRVLTTNFDPLVLRACAMLGEFPAVYDFAISQLFKPGEMPDKAIFHLHGQSTGFVQLNTDQQVADHSQRLGPLFQDAGQARPWIVVGYSGDNDPVFDHLAGTDRFDYHLFWVALKDEAPAKHVRDKLLRPGKDAYVVRGYDADSFFVELAQKLKCFPPDFVRRPFSFLKASLSTLTEYRPLSGENKIDILHDLRGLIGRAVAQFEEAAAETEGQAPRSREAIELAATALLMAGKHDDLKRLEETLGEEISPSLRETFAWSYIQQGNALSDQAKAKSDVDADALFAEAEEKYAAALAINPDRYQALNNWGVALTEQAEAKSDVEADTLFSAAFAKFTAALEKMPRDHEALYNWGAALSAQAQTKDGAEADALFTAAGEKYAAALAIKPNDHEALYNWGVGLSAQAQKKDGAEADALFGAAAEKYREALILEPNMHEALQNWGNLLLRWSVTKGDAELDRMLQEAEARYLKVEGITAGRATYNLACVSARRGDAGACQTWLRRAKDHGRLPDKEHLLRDPDLASVRDEAWFQDFLGELSRSVKLGRRCLGFKSPAM